MAKATGIVTNAATMEMKSSKTNNKQMQNQIRFVFVFVFVFVFSNTFLCGAKPPH